MAWKMQKERPRTMMLEWLFNPTSTNNYETLERKETENSGAWDWSLDRELDNNDVSEVRRFKKLGVGSLQ